MDTNALIWATLGLSLGVIGWFLRVEHARNEKMLTKVTDELSRFNEAFAGIHGKLDELSKIIEHVPDMRRFFGPRGGQARLWGRIEHDVEQIREREHHLVNKLAIIKGSLEMQGIKCGAPGDVWSMPEWKSYKPDSERV